MRQAKLAKREDPPRREGLSKSVSFFQGLIGTITVFCQHEVIKHHCKNIGGMCVYVVKPHLNMQ